MIKHLYADGDSFVFGQELGGEPTPGQFFKHTDHMAEHCFAGLLRKHYGIDGYTNVATPGGANDKVFRQLIPNVLDLLERYRADEIFVFIGWTQPSRREFYCSLKDKWYNHLNNVRNVEQPYKSLTDTYAAYFDSDIEGAARYVSQVMGAQAFLKQYKIPYMMSNTLFNIIDWKPFTDYIPEKIKYWHIDRKRYLQEPMYQFIHEFNPDIPCGPGLHPLEEGHKLLSERFIKHIDENKLLEQP